VPTLIADKTERPALPLQTGEDEQMGTSFLRRVLPVLVPSLVAAAVAGSLAYATIPSRGGVISGCFENRGGDLRVIDAESGATCNTRETPISWNTPSPILRSEGYPGAVGMNLYSYFMATADQTPQTFRFGQVNVETTGVPGDFRLCDPISHLGAFLYVAYVNGVRSVGSIPPAGCTPSHFQVLHERQCLKSLRP
jgi:hypothetical protein